jgi:hypothetical protein
MKNSSQSKKEAKTPLKSNPKMPVLRGQKKASIQTDTGSKLNEIYMDAQQVALELNISKRTIHNMRKRGKLSFTWLVGKMYYFRGEIAGILEANKITKKEHITMRKINESLRKTDKK